jgi:hypothetical protein
MLEYAAIWNMPLAATALPPWLVLAALIGIINAAACFMLVGRQLSRLAWYALLGLFAASLGQVVGNALPLPNPVPIGDVNVLFASLAACGVVLVARVVGF